MDKQYTCGHQGIKFKYPLDKKLTKEEIDKIAEIVYEALRRQLKEDKDAGSNTKLLSTI